jgi:hypothetical protein
MVQRDVAPATQDTGEEPRPRSQEDDRPRLASTIGIREVADASHLRMIWKKELRPVLRTLTFRNGNLAPDPIAYVGYEWGLELFIQHLARDLLTGGYVAEKAEIVRAAKTVGLSRPLAFLTVRDALVYRAITWLVRDDLTRGAREYVAFLRSSKGGVDDSVQTLDAVGVDSFDWFTYWLQREGKISEWLDDEAVGFIVESDIANFYPSIRLDAIREHLHSATRLSKEVVRLCIQLIDGVMPRTDYSETSMLGLPQEVVGASREIAHSLLLHVDQEFAAEGAAGHYTRFMDDIMIGVASPMEAQECISRLQRSLEGLGLYPNAAKTRVVAMDDFLTEHLVETNAQLERVEVIFGSLERGKPAEANLSAAEAANLASISANFRDLEPRPRRWDRVMRRFYTIHRRAGLKDWWSYWSEDLRGYPGSGSHILEYVRAWPLEHATVNDLLATSAEQGNLYPDLCMLTAETVCVAPAPDDPALWSWIADQCIREVNRLKAVDTPKLVERAAAAWAVAAYKFGDVRQRDVLLDAMRVGDPQSALRDQGLAFHVGQGRAVAEWLSTEPGMTAGSALNAEYLRSLQAGDERAVGVALNLIGPQPRLAPLRHSIPPRALALLDALGQQGVEKLQKALPHALRRLQSNPERLRDYRLEWCLRSWAASSDA